MGIKNGDRVFISVSLSPVAEILVWKK